MLRFLHEPAVRTSLVMVGFVLVNLSVTLAAGLPDSTFDSGLFEPIVDESTRFRQTIGFEQNWRVINMGQFVTRIQIEALIFHRCYYTMEPQVVHC